MNIDLYKAFLSNSFENGYNCVFDNYLDKTRYKNYKYRDLKFFDYGYYMENNKQHNELKKEDIPNDIQYISLNFSYQYQIKAHILPCKICWIRISNNIQLNNDSLNGLENLKFLTIDDQFNKPLEVGMIPNTVITFILNTFRYYYPIRSGVIPNSVLYLTLVGGFDQPLEYGTIPYGVIYLEIGGKFNKPIKPGIIPNTVRIIRLGDYFNCSLEIGSIPYGVEEIYFGSSFNQVLYPGIIPSSVKIIIFGKKFNSPLLPYTIPFGVEKVHFGDSFNQPLEENTFPESVIIICFGFYFNKSLHTLNNKRVLPNSLLYLSLDCCFNQKLEIGNLNDGLKCLELGYSYLHQIMPNTIPKTVLYFKIGLLYRHIIDDTMLPPNLIELCIEKRFDTRFIKTDKNFLIVKYDDVLSYSDACEIDFNSYHYTNQNVYNMEKSDDFQISSDYLKNIFNSHIVKITRDKLIGNIIFKELTEKVFDPKRLVKICKKYDIEFAKYIETMKN